MTQYSHNQIGGGGVKSPHNKSYGGGGGGGANRGRSGWGGKNYKHNNNRQNEDKMSDYWEDYLKGGYFNEDGNLKPELVGREKIEPIAQAMAEGFPRLTTNQIRRFFGHSRRIDTRLKTNKNDWASQVKDFKMLDEAASDAYGKQDRKIPHLFYDFIKRNVAAVKCEKDFVDGFIPHFEALVAFGSLHFKKDRN